jgi:hypothetical protein
MRSKLCSIYSLVRSGLAMRKISARLPSANEMKLSRGLTASPARQKRFQSCQSRPRPTSSLERRCGELLHRPMSHDSPTGISCDHYAHLTKNDVSTGTAERCCSNQCPVSEIRASRPSETAAISFCPSPDRASFCNTAHGPQREQKKNITGQANERPSNRDCPYSQRLRRKPGAARL